MAILVLGINHKTATVALREKVAFNDEKRQVALQQLQTSLAESAVIVSTCNRTEIYLHNRQISPLENSEQNQQWLAEIKLWFAQLHHLSLEELQTALYMQQNQQCVTHLMRVACGLDSLILGEPQILGQVKQAYQFSETFYQQQNRMISTELSRLFQKTFSTAKRVRTETEIGGNAVSVAYAACSLARQIFDSFKRLRILLVGAGETIELVSRHLFQHGAKHIMIANRTLANAEALAERVGGQMDILSLNQLQEGLNLADIVISSTGSSDILITKNMVEIAQKQRRFDPMLIIDIAVPRDVEESVHQLEAVYHYSVDDLQNIIQHNMQQREQASLAAEEIIHEECADFFLWLKLHQSSNLIKTYRQQAEQIRLELLDKAALSLHQGVDSEQVLQELSYKLMNRLLHTPTQVMQELVKAGETKSLQLFSKSLGLDEKEEE
ncbi:glutamyl-tRNA reductase [Gallibacterium salpingitidis]|uniref:Glutamyl-tRNA reductase n=1 Tax=Gallibacterium salpingitidis TaxID=505341 RepID=A0A1A7QD36_9PAST|nr:glutamyl-tRNA reductase [Gallibacterium salpingitidis]OBW96000.1 glutamyl-tRNA reductase [Gallibacterium salpingitidis]OBX09289.1 glutamyl-tRNA reductase [Gallibacterium salpingitidis]OBX11852.1 glutamyl-tRNA reductase [Gallibacterium salpingitidis]WKT00263.1 glutamyl-tRNA reductase [Gallibacterium salpingitidis]